MSHPTLEAFESYQIYRKLADLKEAELRRARRDCDTEKAEQLRRTLSDLEQQMKEISERIDHYIPSRRPCNYNSLKQADDRIFLRCRYVLGHTMEEIAEEMHISRDTAYRIRRRISDSL